MATLKIDSKISEVFCGYQRVWAISNLLKTIVDTDKANFDFGFLGRGISNITESLNSIYEDMDKVHNAELKCYSVRELFKLHKWLSEIENEISYLINQAEIPENHNGTSLKLLISLYAIQPIMADLLELFDDIFLESDRNAA